MATPDPSAVNPGDRLYRWWDAGGGKTFGAYTPCCSHVSDALAKVNGETVTA